MKVLFIKICKIQPLYLLFLAVFVVFCQVHLRLILPNTDLVVVQIFKCHLSSSIYYSLVLLELSFLPSTICICAFFLFLLSLNIFSNSICFQWFMLLLPIVCFPFSSSTSQSSTCSFVSSSFLKIEHIVCVIFWVVLFYIPCVQSNFQLNIIRVTILYIFFHLPFALLYSSCFKLSF